MTLRVLAGALALSLGAAALAPVAAEANDRDWRDGRRDGRVRVVRSYSYRRAPVYRSYRYSRPYRYRTYGYGYGVYPYYYDDSYYYDGYYDYGYGSYGGYYEPYRYRRAPLVVGPSYRYRGYRPLLGLRVGGPHFGVWLGF